MILAIASGKGGTGKTTIALGLAFSVGGPVQLLDCDVEEPNCHLFLQTDIREREPCHILVPVLDADQCRGCGRCSRGCQFNAIAFLKDRPVFFPELCHGCGACAKLCPPHAIREIPREIGVQEIGACDGVEFAYGRLNVGQAMATPLIHAVKKRARSDGLVVLDCPPSAACSMVAAIHGADYAMLVAEPTPFGLHDLNIAVETARKLAVPFGVIINRADAGDDRVAAYCAKEHIPVLLQIPEERSIAEAYSRGVRPTDVSPRLRDGLLAAYAAVRGLVCSRGAYAGGKGGMP